MTFDFSKLFNPDGSPSNRVLFIGNPSLPGSPSVTQGRQPPEVFGFVEREVVCPQCGANSGLQRIKVHERERCRHCGWTACSSVRELLTGIDGTTAVVDTAIRNFRLSQYPPRTLYHQTDPEAAKAILSTQCMRRGEKGMVGGGIYFAETPLATQHKALHHGVILAADVKLGKFKLIAQDGDRGITFQSLVQQGCDSVMFFRPGGTEYVVYSSDQVTNIRVADTS
jgi:hypothetical protein